MEKTHEELLGRNELVKFDLEKVRMELILSGFGVFPMEQKVSGFVFNLDSYYPIPELQPLSDVREDFLIPFEAVLKIFQSL